MDKAKAAVSNFLAKDGKHDTTVHETVNPSITNEHVTGKHHEEAQTLVDREVHQHHHHTSVQPITHKEVLPEQHSHNMAGVETREHRHGNDDHVKERLAAEAAQFKDTREVGETKHTSSAAPTVAGEHVHHHVHETIQPVVQKETIQPSVVHTTIPVHEIHHNEAKHHAATSLPAVTMAEFQKQGGALGGREERTDAFAGEPRAVGSTLGGKNSSTLGGPGAAGSTSVTGKERGIGGVTDGINGSTAHGTHQHGTTGTSDTAYNNSTTGTTDTTGTKKASLMDKVNPKVDSDGDGKRGFLK